VRASRFAGRVLSCTLLVLVAVAVLAHALDAESSGPLTDEVALRAADCARSLSRGEGLTTSIVYPVTFGLGHGIDRAPLLSGGPLLPVLLAGYFRSRGEADLLAGQVRLQPGGWVLATYLRVGLAREREWLQASRAVHNRADLTVRLCSCVGFLVCLAAGMALGARLRGFGTGMLTGAAFILSPQLVRVSVSGGPTIWAAAWLLIAVTLLTGRDQGVTTPAARGRRADRLGLVRSAVAGMCLALCYLSEPVTLVLAPLAMAIFSRRPDGSRDHRTACALAVGLLLCAGPWWVRNTMLGHDPLFSLDRYGVLANTPDHPGASLLRTEQVPQSLLLYVVTHPGLYLARAASNLAAGLATVGRVAGLLVLSLAAGAYLARPRGRDERALRAMLAAGLLALGAWSALAPFAATTPVIVLPLCAALAASVLPGLIAGLGRCRRAVTWSIVGALAVAPTAAALVDPAPIRVPLAAAAALEAGAKLPRGEVTISDEPAAVALYGDRTAVLLPQGQDSLDEVRSRAHGRQVAYLLTAAALSAGQLRGADRYLRELGFAKLPRGLTDVPLRARGARLVVEGPVPSRLALGAPGARTGGEGDAPWPR
jgi:hypothetical protein